MVKVARDSQFATPVCTRLATSDDIPGLLSLINSAYAIETFFDGTRTDAERLAVNLRKGEILVMEGNGGKLLACIYLENRGENGYLGQFAVDPSKQGSGLGRQIVEIAEERLRSQGCRAVEIVVLSLRPELPPIYRRFGYHECGTEAFTSPRPFKSEVECHAIVMSKLL